MQLISGIEADLGEEVGCLLGMSQKPVLRSPPHLGANQRMIVMSSVMQSDDGAIDMNSRRGDRRDLISHSYRPTCQLIVLERKSKVWSRLWFLNSIIRMLSF